MSYLLSFLISILIGLVSGAVVILVFRRVYIGFWAFIAGIAPDWPRIFLTPLGLTNMENLLLVTHTAGLFIFPLLLVLIDIPLMEIGFFKFLKPFNNYLPENIKSILKTETLVERLQKYKILPRPARIKFVYLAGMFAGLVHILINFLTGTL